MIKRLSKVCLILGIAIVILLAGDTAQTGQVNESQNINIKNKCYAFCEGRYHNTPSCDAAMVTACKDACDLYWHEIYLIDY